MSAGFKTLDDLPADLTGKRVLVRVDLNVPVKDGKVTDATRIERVAPTILELSKKGAKVVLLAHFGRPKGEPVADQSLGLIVPAVKDVLGRPVAFAEDCIGDKAKATVDALKNGDILLLEPANAVHQPRRPGHGPGARQAFVSQVGEKRIAIVSRFRMHDLGGLQLAEGRNSPWL